MLVYCSLCGCVSQNSIFCSKVWTFTEAEMKPVDEIWFLSESRKRERVNVSVWRLFPGHHVSYSFQRNRVSNKHKQIWHSSSRHLGLKRAWWWCFSASVLTLLSHTSHANSWPAAFWGLGSSVFLTSILGFCWEMKLEQEKQLKTCFFFFSN